MMKVFTSALVLAASVSASPIAKLSARSALDCVNNASNGTVFTAASGAQFQVLCATDYAGGDMGSTTTNTFEDCINACDSTSGCVDVSYVTGNCYMKNTLTSPSVNANVWTAKQLTSSTTVASTTSTTSTSTSSTASASSTLTCDGNASNGTTYTTANGEAFQVYCATDFWGGDLLNQNTGSFSDCIELCSTTDSCIDVSYVAPTCYLKSTLTAAVSNTNVWSAKLPSVAIPVSSSSSSAVQSSTVLAVSSVVSTPVAVVSSATTVVPVVVSSSAAASSSVVVSSSAAASSSAASTTPVKTTTPAATTSAAASSTASSSTRAATTSSAAPSTTSSSTRASSTTPVVSSTSSKAASSTTSASKTTSSAASTTSSASKSVFTVLSAFYGDLDVTQNVIKNWVTPYSLIVDTFTTEWSLGIADPWFGNQKTIVILYSLNGKQQYFTANQYTIVLPLTAYYQGGAVDVSTIAAPAGSAIKVLGATWGANKVTSTSFFNSFYSSYAAGKAVTFNDATFGYSSYFNQFVGVVYYLKNGSLNAFVGREGVSKVCN